MSPTIVWTNSRLAAIEDNIFDDISSASTEGYLYYDDLEPGIRDIVRMMRDNGFTTIMSCGHEMYVIFAVYNDKDTTRLDRILRPNYRNYKIDQPQPIDKGWQWLYCKDTRYSTVWFDKGD